MSNVPSSTSVYQARGITKVYRMGEVEVHALRGVDLDLYEGEFIVLLGPSGSGKSTLLNILGGLDVPTAGTVAYRGKDLTSDDDALLTSYRRNHVGFVFQFYNLIPSLTARENVALVTEIAKNPMVPKEALELVSLGRSFGSLPGPTFRRRATACRDCARGVEASRRPAVRRADRALDIQTGIVVLEVIQRVNQELGTTTAVITHNAAIADMADRVIHVSDGRIGSVERNTKKIPPCELRW